MNFQVVTYEVLAPTCGQVQCHSTTTAVKGWALDTLEGARAAMMDTRLHNDSLLLPSEADPNQIELVHVITVKDGSRMPPDSPLNQADIDLIKAWVDQGEPGLGTTP